MKKLSFIQRNNQRHWVGNGFPVRSIFSYNERAADFSPFLLLDYAGPTTFPPTTERKGVGEHPHRGFETVTIVYSGEVEHRDSTGGGGIIGPGDVQWMTAAGGLVHEEFHGPKFAQTGGAFEMVQLWVNLPAKDKMAPPRYQNILSSDIPVVPLAGGSGEVRVIAGEFDGRRGPAKTFTPIHVWDVRLKKDATLRVPEGFTTALVVLKGSLKVNGAEVAESPAYVLLDPEGTEIRLETATGATVLLLGGEPIDEPIAGYGPFVMNTQGEIRQAMIDFQTGKMGRLG